MNHITDTAPETPSETTMSASGTTISATPEDAALPSPASEPDLPDAPVMPEGDPLITATYDTDLELLTHFADIIVGKRQRTFALVAAIIDFAVALFAIIAFPSFWLLAIVIAAIGIGMLVWRGKASRMVATRLLRELDPSEYHRSVSVYPTQVVLTLSHDEQRVYATDDLDDVQDDGAVAVLIFGQQGIVVPRTAILQGTWEDLLEWGRQHVETDA